MTLCFDRGPTWGVCSLTTGHPGWHEAYMDHKVLSGKPSATWPNPTAPPATEGPATDRVEALAEHLVEQGFYWESAATEVAACALRWVEEHPEPAEKAPALPALVRAYREAREALYDFETHSAPYSNEWHRLVKARKRARRKMFGAVGSNTR